MSDCSYPPCTRLAFSKGFCTGHYQQRARGVDLVPLRTRRNRGAVLVRNERGEKECLGCGAWLPEGEFFAWVKSSDGLSSRCRDCQKDYDLQRQYGISLAEFRELLADQGGCAACGTEDPGGMAWHVDHDHACCPTERTCGRCVRGVLCGQCNKGLGHFGDDPARLEAGAKYLRSWNEMQHNNNDQEG